MSKKRSHRQRVRLEPQGVAVSARPHHRQSELAGPRGRVTRHLAFGLRSGMTVRPGRQHPPLSAYQVLREHEQLYRRLRDDGNVAGYVQAFAAALEQEVPRRPDLSQGSLAQMFWPCCPWENDDEAWDFTWLLADSLYRARTYQVTAKMVEAVTALYEQVSKGGFRLLESELPSPHGFVWLDRPLDIADAQSGHMIERAYSWTLTTADVDRETAFGTVTEEGVPVVRLASWAHTDDPDHILSADEVGYLATLGSLSLSHVQIVPIGPSRTWELREYDAAAHSYRVDGVTAWLRALWKFMESEVATTTTHRPPAFRGGPRRSRLKGVPEVSVILLRRSVVRTALPEGHVPQHIEWSCRWLVAGHWRHARGTVRSYLAQGIEHHHPVPGSDISTRDAACVTCGEKITWFGDMIKGPADKPFRHRGQLYKLAR